MNFSSADRNPFPSCSRPGRPLSFTQSQNWAINEILTSIVENKPLTVIRNPGGCGATTILDSVAKSSGINDHPAQVHYSAGPSFSSRDPAKELAKLIGLNPRYLRQYAIACVQSEQRLVWIVDQCSAIRLSALRKMVGNTPGVCVIASIQFTAPTVLWQDERTVDLQPMSLQETEAFILRKCAATGQTLAPEIAKRISIASGGRVKTVCELLESHCENLRAA